MPYHVRIRPLAAMAMDGRPHTHFTATTSLALLPTNRRPPSRPTSLAETDMSAAETMAQIASRALDVEHDERAHMEELHMLGLDHSCALPPPVVEGRVFQRLYRYHLLPPQLQVLSDAVAVYLVSPEVRSCVFTMPRWSHRPHHPHLPRVKGEKLIDEVRQFLVNSQRATSDVLDSAQQIADALVLSGFISPIHEPKNEDHVVTYVHEREVYELVAPGAQHLVAETVSSDAGDELARAAPEYQKKSVWAVTDGATRAGVVFQKPETKAGVVRHLFASMSICGTTTRRETKRYAVINKPRHHALFLFASDCARQELNHIPLQDALVKYELGTARAPLYHGLKIWTDTNFEVLDFVSKHRQEDWLLSLLDAGAQYMETHRDHETWAAGHASFYQLSDVDAVGREFFFEELLGKVVLLVNVASKDPEAPLQYPELVALADKYDDQGLRVIAFPCDQFGGEGQEFDTDSEILTYLEQAYHVRFPILTRRDVNGPLARPAFLYLNAHLPGRFGPFTEWSFTKFLVGRDGKPFKRYETRELPAAAMEDDIKRLLAATNETSSPTKTKTRGAMMEEDE